MIRTFEHGILDVMLSIKRIDWNKRLDGKKVPKLLNVPTRIRAFRWEKRLKINKRFEMLIRARRVLRCGKKLLKQSVCKAVAGFQFKISFHLFNKSRKNSVTDLSLDFRT